MENEKAAKTTSDTEHEQMFANWVYQVPGVLLIAIGFGGVAFLALG